MAIFGFNFRQSNAGSFLDIEDANQTYVIPQVAGDQYPVTRNGIQFGCETGTSTWDSRDRNAGLDPRLAGIAFNNLVAVVPTFRVDLPSTGLWQIRLAMGDADAPQTIFLKLQDDTTDFATFDTTSSNALRWRDATDVERTEVTWPTSNVQIPHTFTSTILRLIFGNGSTKSGLLAHLELESGAAPPVSVGGGYDQVIIHTRGWGRWR